MEILAHPFPPSPAFTLIRMTSLKTVLVFRGRRAPPSEEKKKTARQTWLLPRKKLNLEEAEGCHRGISESSMVAVLVELDGSGKGNFNNNAPSTKQKQSLRKKQSVRACAFLFIEQP
jgi:hypothetical protein